MLLPFDQLPRNPHYGSGSYRRRIQLDGSPGQVHVELEDDYHALRLTLRHADGVVRDVTAQTLRVPANTCHEAPQALLQAYAGQPLTADRSAFRGMADPRSHCTHLHDMLGLACAQALRPAGSRRYDVSVPDLVDGRSRIGVVRDGLLVHEWLCDLSTLIEPAPLAGRPLKKGFARWAYDTFEGDALEAAFVLQMGAFLSPGRQLDAATIDTLGLESLPPGGLGACYSYQPLVFTRHVVSRNSIRDFSTRPDDLLTFG